MAIIPDNNGIYDFLMIQGSYKGRVGEHLFQATRRRLFLTTTFSKELLLTKIKPGLTQEQFDFLDKYWYSIDGLEFVNYIPHLFEIKIRQERYKQYTLTLTQTAAQVYPLAQKLGFVCKFGLVSL